MFQAGTIDSAAVAAVREERVDWRFRSVAPSLSGLTIGEAAARGAKLFEDGFLGPFVVLDEEAVEHNLRTMAAWCAERGVALAPHGKTTMAPQLFERQLKHGSWGITCANAGHLRIYRAFGVSRILLANQLLDPSGLKWLAAELDADDDFEFVCWVDSVRGVELMTEALRGARRKVDVLVELGAEGGRTGVRDTETALAVAEAAHASPALRLRGSGGYEGALSHHTDEKSLQLISSYVDGLRELVFAFHAKGLLDDAGQIIVTGGGSAYFDRVADELTKDWGDLDVLPILRSGAYVTHDDGFYRVISPLGEHPRIGGVASFRSALRAWAQVTSKPTDELALLTIGKRDASFDEGMPEPRLIRKGDGPPSALEGHSIQKMNDQHAFLTLPASSPVEVGDWIALGLSHPCTVFDKWPLIPVVGPDGETVLDFVRTHF
ncbi:amino acid deaminase [Amycolatopsis keratiniphila]|uniref:D-amino acid deaminase n=1 Tax=Amycolatopsis keratiniphila TaxID=129921 RepID=R4T9U5_9PSEU|nr:amino acid deaminase [Amycolatopsis keratiniphila]AGM07662.1 D-amino acid deaminase [Amycolatopsis keratiniphila]OLZ59079.1 amino acid deaminase [Amycolatopsis keratiniphila subsp. nogabecina]SDU05008.1 D-serine deaminase, pyridoxal phosphate-dependent [Amycolatopsis keratiniphila]